MTPGAELGDILPPPAALQGPWETPTGLELWASPGSRTQEALQQLGASSNLSHPLPPGCSGFQQVSFEELNSGASPPPPRVCAVLTGLHPGIGAWGGGGRHSADTSGNQDLGQVTEVRSTAISHVHSWPPIR